MSKNLKKLFLLVAMIATVIVCLAFSASAANNDFAGGVGTEDAPYLISTKEHLNNVRKDLNAHYKMIADIHFEESDFKVGGLFYNAGKGWESIGNSSAYFSGVFDGNNFTVSGLYINISSSKISSEGLFGYSNGKISNLSVKNSNYSVSINGTSGDRFYVGGIVGFQSGGEINNCFSSVNIISSTYTKYYYPYAGGIVGFLEETTISSCKNEGTISVSGISSSNAGGICGGSSYTYTIDNCYNKGNISGGKYSGGIVGNAYYNQTIINCANAGLVTATYTAGGICGTANYECNIVNCYNTGSISSASTETGNSSLAYSYSGGICGKISDCNVINCYNIGKIKSNAVRSLTTSTAYAKAGGIVGQTSGKIKNSYNAGTIISDDYAAGICGFIDIYNGGDISNCYFLDCCSKGVFGVSDTAVRLEKSQMLILENFKNFDFGSVWTMQGDKDYLFPELISLDFICIHSYDSACDNMCDICNFIRTAGHSYSSATCIHPKICTVCGKTEGEALGHKYYWYHIDSMGDNAYDLLCNECNKNFGRAYLNNDNQYYIYGYNENGIFYHYYYNENAECLGSEKCDIDFLISDDEYHQGVCKCRLMFEEEPHSCNNVVIEKATTTNNGEIVTKCSCGKVESSEIIPKISSVTLSKTNYIYDGKNKTPKVTVTDTEGNTLIKNIDYKISVASKRSGIGRYTVKVTFIGNYEGTENLYFYIKPGKPSSVKSASQTTSAIKLSWSAVDGAAGYNVYRYSPSKKAYVQAGTTEGTSLTVKSLYAGTKYTFRVVAYGKTSTGKVYESDSYALLKTATKTATPTLSKVTTTKGKAVLTHTNVSGETGYTVYYSTKKDSGFKKYANFTADTTTCNIKNLTSGKTYYFKVRTYIKTDSGYVYSAWSTVKSVKVK